eukprot:CAMPEP_0182867062 /NCGR_PEP_ID=MMETSP0034_2-20130328/8520_1 /TAXON_ID=156128 /ORGANISM="Nephroselmis pyriformis, Strain CCMP717" /LENGTH=444 /DNA_ID=CAMNT_0024999397 /DNA_START=210 /DNA_END=1540 /DNA_ORIENTATION=+
MSVQLERSRIEQIAGETFLKAAHVVLGARVHAGTSSRARSEAKANRWFNLHVEENESCAPLIEPWRKDTSSPLVLEVFLHTKESSGVVPGEPAPQGSNENVELLERWSFQFVRGAPAAGGGGGNHLETPVVYKRTAILLRSLHMLARRLPAYKVHRAQLRAKGSAFVLSYRIAPAATSAGLVAQPLPHAASGDESGYEKFAFTPVATPFGTLQMDVQYRGCDAITALEVPPPPLPLIIESYLESPQQQAGTLEGGDRYLLHATSIKERGEGFLPPPPRSGGAAPAGGSGARVPELAPSGGASPEGSSIRRHSWAKGTYLGSSPTSTASVTSISSRHSARVTTPVGSAESPRSLASRAHRSSGGADAPQAPHGARGAPPAAPVPVPGAAGGTARPPPPGAFAGPSGTSPGSSRAASSPVRIPSVSPMRGDNIGGPRPVRCPSDSA